MRLKRTMGELRIELRNIYKIETVRFQGIAHMRILSSIIIWFI